MADLKQRAKEQRDAEPVSDGADITQESFKGRTSSLKSNSSRPPSQLSPDGPESPLNGAQPALSPCATVATDASPAEGLANGPSSHAASDEYGFPHRERDDGTSEQPRKASQSPSESKADAPKKVPGFVSRGSAAQVCANVTPPKANDSESEALDGLSEENEEEVPVSQIRGSKGIGSRRIWDFDMESSDSSSDDYESGSDLNWDPQKEFMQFLWNDHDDPDLGKKLEEVPPSTSERRRKRKMDMVVMVDPSEKVYSKRSPVDDDSDYEESVPDAIPTNRVHSLRRKTNSQSSDQCEKYPSDTVEAIKQLILSAPAKKNQDGGICEADAGTKLKAEQSDMGSEEEPSFFPCTKCNVNFKEKKHLHRHMMYHLDGHSQFRHMNVPRPFICRECGRSFRDRNSLLKHMIIHQERREKLMEEIKGLNELKDEGRSARLQCPQCVFGTNCPNTFVQHAKTHEKDKRYYCCEECSFMAVTEHELEGHLYTTHRVARKPQYVALRKSERPQEQGRLAVKKNNASGPLSFPCKICPFSTPNRNVLKKHVELIHQQPYHEDSDSPPYESSDDYAAPAYETNKLAGKPQKADAHRLEVKPKFSIDKQSFRKRAELPFWSDDIADLIRKKKTTQKARKGFHSSLSKWSSGSSANKLSPTSRKSEKQSRLSPQQAEKIDVTTGLPYDEDGYKDDDQGYGSTFSGNLKKPNSLQGCYKQTTPKTEKSNSSYYLGCDSDKGQRDGEEPERKRLAVETPVKGKSPSKRKMSTPFHNTMDKATHMVLPKHEQTPKKHESPENKEEAGFEDAYNFADYTSEATSNFLDSNENEQNPYARNYFIRRQRFPAKDEWADLSEKEGEMENGDDTIQKFVVKEECIETEVCADTPEPSAAPQSESFSDLDTSPFGTDRKSCPYCPAQFESGVGLSNHVRGHLHRVGLSYNARHVVSPEQVASQDRRPRIRRKLGAIRRMKKAHKPESQTEHTCPLCGGWFDTKTGLSNHVRGHLKRIGKTISSTSKSPLCILNEMMQDENEYRNILQVLNKKQFLSRPFVSQKFACSDGLFLSPAGVPVKVQHVGQDGKTWAPASGAPQEEEGPEKKQAEPKPAAKGPNSSTLIELLRKKKMDEEMEMKNRSQTARKYLTSSPPKERSAAAQPVRAEPRTWTPEKNELNKKVCVHCNTTFPSAVSLSNHLRAYARRKRAALLEGTTYDCKQKKQRSRPGPKKKMSPLPHVTDEIYRLTCRFCDLVFQGPLSVQEDWVKHLQRHIMNTSVPRTGAGMVEVTSLPKDPAQSPERHSPPLVTQVAS